MQTKEITQTGQKLLDEMRKNWFRFVEQGEYTAADGEAYPLPAKRVKSQLATLNKGIEAQRIYRILDAISPGDVDRAMELIQKHQFDVEQAEQVYFVTPVILGDQRTAIRTWEQAKAANSPTFACIRKYKGEEKAQAVLELMLRQTVERFGKRADISDEQLGALVGDIMGRYPTLRMAEVKKILGDLITNASKIFAVDHPLLLSLFESKMQEKMEEAEQKNIDAHEMGKPESRGVNFFEEYYQQQHEKLYANRRALLGLDENK